MSPSDTPSRGRRILTQSQRWTRRIGTLLVVLVFLVVAGGIALWTTGGGLVAEKLAGFVNTALLGKETRLVVDHIGGTLFHRIRIDDLRLEREGIEETYPFAAADELTVTYDLWGVLNGRFAASRVEARGLRVELRTFGDGPIRLPTTRSLGGGGGGAPPRVWIKELILEDAQLYLDLPWRGVELDSVYAVASVEPAEGGFRLELDHLVGRLQDGMGTLELDTGAVIISDAVRLEDVTGRWEGAPLEVDGVVSGEPLDLNLAVSDLPLERLGRFLEEDALEPGEIKTIRGRLTQETDALTFDWEAEGRWDTWDFTELTGRGRIRDDFLVLSEVHAVTEGAVISGATIDIPLKRDDLTITGTVENLMTSTLRVPAIDPYPGVMSGSGTIRVGDRTELLRQVDAKMTLGNGNLLDVPFVGGEVSARIRNEVWSLDTVRVALADAQVRGHGSFGPDSLDLSFGYRGDLKPWRQFIAQDNLTGRGQLRVRIHGASDHPVLEARGGLSQLTLAQIQAPEVELRQAVGSAANPRNLALGFDAPKGVTLGNVPFSRAGGDLVITEDKMVMDALHLERGDTSVTVAGDLKWEPFVQIAVGKAEAVVDGRRFWMSSPGQISYDQNVISTPGIQVETPRGRLFLSGSWNTETRETQADISLTNLDPSVFFPPDAPPSVAVGKVQGTLQFSGVAPYLRGRADLGLREVDWEGGHVDTAAVVIAVDDRTITFERVEPFVDRGRILVTGDLTLPEPLPETIEDIRQGKGIDSTRTVWNLTVAATRVDAAKWRFLIPGRERMAGQVSAVAEVRGTSADPELRLEGEVRDLIWKEAEAQLTRLRATYAAGTVHIDSLETWQADKKLQVTGTIPLNLTLYPFSWGFPPESMDLMILADAGSLSSLRLTPWIRKATGNLNARIHVTGTPEAPLLDGQATVKNGRVELEERDEILEEAEAVFRFDSDLITVESARARLALPWAPKTKGGWVTAEGTYRLGALEENTYELRAHLDDVLVGQEGEYAARVSGDLTLTPIRASDGNIYPYGQGDLFVSRAEYAGSLEPQDIGEFKPPSILYSVNIDAPSRILVRTEEVDAELGGELSVRQELDGQVYIGELDIDRGTYQFFQKTFRVTQGTLTWTPESRLPEMDITAETLESGYRITVVLTGRPDKPVLTFSAQRDGQDANLTQSEIIQLIAVGASGLGALGVPTGIQNPEDQASGTDKAVAGVANIFLGEVERRLAREIGLVDEIEIETETETGDYELLFGVRKYVTPELSLQYRQGLSATYQQNLAVEYRLGRIVLLRGAFIRYPQEASGVQEYNLDLKIRREY